MRAIVPSCLRRLAPVSLRLGSPSVCGAAALACATSRALFLICAVSVGWLAGGCATVSSGAFTNVLPVAPDPGAASYETNTLHEGDVVSIAFEYSTNFDAVQKITLDGMLNLESVGQIKAAGKTPLALQSALAKVYKPLTKGDVVTVKLVSAIDGVYVSGAVFHPGRVPLERPMTVVEAIMEAGGFDPSRARLSAVTVLRIEAGKQRSYHLNLQRVLQGRDEVPFYVRPFDVINVPVKTFNF